METIEMAKRIVGQWDNYDRHRHVHGEDEGEPNAVTICRDFLQIADNPIMETIRWWDAETHKPDDDRDLLGMFYSTPVICHWWQEDGCFRFTGDNRPAIGIKYWAEMPRGPHRE
jgi:hypothetical protein